MRVGRACGQALPHHINMFVPAILEVVRDRDETMRASSLSNLATVCELLRFSLYTFLEEVIACLTSVLKTDESDEVRRGACSVLTGILRGAESDAFDVLGAATLKVRSSTTPLPPPRCSTSLRLGGAADLPIVHLQILVAPGVRSTLCVVPTGPSAAAFVSGAFAQDILILVRHVEDCDTDEITRYHARMARGHLQEIVRKFMQPGRKMPAGVFLPSQFGH